MTRQFETDFWANAICIVESLAPDERKTGRHLNEDLEALLLQQKIAHSFNEVGTAGQFRELMRQLAMKARDEGIRPILHLEVHGLENRKGLQFLPSRERMLWSEFAELAREVNVATGNNLLVVMAVCHGFHAVLEVRLNDVTPCCVLLGTQDVVTNQQVLAAFGTFYRRLFETNDVEAAYGALPPGFRHFTCEEVLVKSFARYFQEACKGAGRRRRVESLVTQAMQLAQHIPLRNVRQFVKTYTRPARESFLQYRKQFLMAEHPGNVGRFTVTFDDVMEELKSR